MLISSRLICLTTVLYLTMVTFISCSNYASHMDNIAEKYVKLVLQTGTYDALYVDAYYGPKEWKDSLADTITNKKYPVNILIQETETLLSQLGSISKNKLSEIEKMRLQFLKSQLISLKTKLLVIDGKTFDFDQESLGFYGVKPPVHSNDYYEDIVSRIEKILPGNGDPIHKLEILREKFTIPSHKIQAVFKLAIDECRKRSLEFICLPDNENFEIEFVKNQPWAAYNWYKGNNYSLIQINTDSPVLIDRAVHLASHEGYPGHHVYNSLLETKLVKEKKWIEYAIYPLFSPISLIAEGTANYAEDLIFTKQELYMFIAEKLCKEAGLDSTGLSNYLTVQELIKELSYANTDAARQYLNGELTRDETISWLINNALRTEKGATQSIRFIETYRSYVINYSYGQDIIKTYIENKAASDAKLRKKLFIEILSSPMVPSMLVTE